MKTIICLASLALLVAACSAGGRHPGFSFKSKGSYYTYKGHGDKELIVFTKGKCGYKGGYTCDKECDDPVCKKVSKKCGYEKCDSDEICVGGKKCVKYECVKGYKCYVVKKEECEVKCKIEKVEKCEDEKVLVCEKNWYGRRLSGFRWQNGKKCKYIVKELCEDVPVKKCKKECEDKKFVVCTDKECDPKLVECGDGYCEAGDVCYQPSCKKVCTYKKKYGCW